ncbi:MAG: S8 family serine peptidase [Bacteroidota bacterium]|nr:S8 family serine peptidase [Bacteroidota bacterium]
MATTLIDRLQKNILRALFLMLLLPALAIGQKSEKYTLPKGIATSDISHDFIIIKLKDTPGTDLSDKADKLVKLIKAKKAIQALPSVAKDNQKGRAKTNLKLDNIFKIELMPSQDVLQAINNLINVQDVEYVEPYYLIKTLTSPNDPGAAIINGAQYYLNNIKAREAWNIEKGNSKVIVGVIDTGVDYEHEDLKANHIKNISDPIDKFDNDNDGYIDNYMGWDFGDNDNNPFADGNAHGSQVAGVIAGTPDNAKGIAGIGYNSSYMPIKVFRTRDNLFIGGFEAILYAADKGCSVVNLSWGSANAYSKYAQDIINYAVLQKDVVVVAAAGNTGSEVYFYPASYDNVLSVGSSDSKDKKVSWSTFNDKVDLLAPGASIYTTTNNNSYSNVDGTSLSAPMVAGAAALVRAKYPHLTAVQVMEKIRVSCDDIYQISENKPFMGKLGKGRLNIEKALQDLNLPSITIEKTTFENKFGNFAFFDDTLKIKLSFKNYLAAATNLKFTLISENPYATVLDSVFVLQALNTLQSSTNNDTPFNVYLKSTLPPSQSLKFRIKIQAGDFTDLQYFTITSSPSYLTLDKGGLGFTVASDGNLGINNDYNYLGNGITYNNQRILEQVGVIIASAPDKVLNNVIRNFDYGIRDRDFASTENIKYYGDSEAPVDARSAFQPLSGSTNFIGLNVDQKVLSWDGPADKKFVIVEYHITNTSGSVIENLKTGIFANWDINTKSNNTALWDEANKLGYVYDKLQNNIYAGVSLLTPQNPTYYAIDQHNLNGNTASFGSDFTRENKFKTLTSGTSILEAGKVGNGNNVSHTVGATIGLLKVGESAKIAFAFVAGDNLEDIQASVQQALRKYTLYRENPPLLLSLNTCTGKAVQINPSGGNYEFYEDVDLKKLIASGTSLSSGNIWESKTIYATNMDRGFRGDVRQIKINVDETLPNFRMDVDTLILKPGISNFVKFSDISKSANSWVWDFSNGYKSTVKDPKIKFTDPGTYNIILEVKNSTGCTGTITKKLVVLKQGAAPIVDDISICFDENALINAHNTFSIKVYSDITLKNLVFQGAGYTTEKLQSSKRYYVTNAAEAVESEPSEINVSVAKVQALFEFQVDTIDLLFNNRIQFINGSKNAIYQEWYVNGRLISTDAQPLFENVEKIDKEVKLIVWNENNCKDALTRILQMKKSAKPEDKTYVLCKGADLSIDPGAGNVYYFYDGPEMKNIIHKGKSLNLKGITTNKEIIITNADSFIESEPARIIIEVITLKADFALTNELNIYENDNINITNMSTGAKHFSWDLGNGNIQNVEVPVVKYLVSGKYRIKLTTTSNLGCEDTIEKEVIVKPAQLSGGLDKKLVQFFPNPSTGSFYLKINGLKSEKVTMTLKNSIGTMIHSSLIINTGKPQQFDFSELKEGIYLVNIQSSEGNYLEKLIISK